MARPLFVSILIPAVSRSVTRRVGSKIAAGSITFGLIYLNFAFLLTSFCPKIAKWRQNRHFWSHWLCAILRKIYNLMHQVFTWSILEASPKLISHRFPLFPLNLKHGKSKQTKKRWKEKKKKNNCNNILDTFAMSPAAADLESLPAYCTILAQCLSPSAPGAGGEQQDSHLAVAEEKSGRVEVLALEDLVSREAKGSTSGSHVRPRASLRTGAPALAMCSLADRDLVVGERLILLALEPGLKS